MFPNLYLNTCLFGFKKIILSCDLSGTWYEWEGYAKEGGRQYQCPHCAKCFASHQSLVNHTPYHEGKTTCQICGKVETTRSNLARHMKTTHPSI